MIRLKTKEEISSIRRAGEIVSETLQLLSSKIHPGVSTLELDEIAREFIVSRGGIPAFKDYRGFPGNICVSEGNIVVHGIPDAQTKIKNNCIVSIDVGVALNNYYADSAYTFSIGRISRTARRLLSVTKEALYRGIDKACQGNRLSDISHCIQHFVESNGFSVVRDFVGHGIGYELHEDPEVPNFGEPNRGVRLEEGMVLAIEPMVNEGTYKTKVLSDGWTVVTYDGALSSHFEHTITIGKNGPEVLTAWHKRMQ
jgi:methionyl aminopeptidase